MEGEKSEAVKCPRCAKTLEYLHYTESGTINLNFHSDGGYYQPNDDMLGFKGDKVIDEFRCPCCAETICKTQEDALKFLRGGKLTQ